MSVLLKVTPLVVSLGRENGFHCEGVNNDTPFVSYYCN